MNPYISYYENQVGTGGVIDNVYVGSTYQRGHGIGSFLGGLFRRALPLIRSGFRAVGKEALRTGLNVMDDVTNKNINIKESLQKRMMESADNLKNKAEKKIENLMAGRGYKSGGARASFQSTRTSLNSNKLNKTRNRVIHKRKHQNKNHKRKKTQKNKKKQAKQRKKKEKKPSVKTNKRQKRTVYDIFD